MCEPATLTAATAFLTSNAFLATTAVAATAVSAYSIYAGGQAKQQEAEFNAAQERINAGIASQQAADAMDRGNREAIEQARRIAAVRGEQQAGLSAAGLDITFGSPADTIFDTTLRGGEDQRTIAENAMREAQGFRISAANARSTAGAYTAAGRNARTASYLDMGSTILSGATRTGEINAKYGKRKAS